MLLEVLPALLAEGMQLALLGAGDAELEAQFLAAAESYPGKVGVKIGHDETLAHRIQAGADALLMPSRFEPCGLTQLCALRYGAVPIVGRVGGLVDTVIDASEMGLASGAATGVQFSPVTSDSLAIALWRTARLFRNKTAWKTMQKNGMGTDVSWHRPAHRYATLYRELCGYTGEASVSVSAKGDVAGVEAPASESGKGKVADNGAAGSEGEKGKAASAGMAGLASENSIVSFAGRAASESERSKVVSAGMASPPSVKAAVSLAATASPESEKGAVSFSATAGSGGEKTKVVDIEADESGDEADNVVSIACRDA
jgi:hypothetical protein